MILNTTSIRRTGGTLCTDGEIRTPDYLIPNQAAYHLHTPVKAPATDRGSGLVPVLVSEFLIPVFQLTRTPATPGGNGLIRTVNLPIFSRALCQLSYSAAHGILPPCRYARRPVAQALRFELRPSRFGVGTHCHCARPTHPKGCAVLFWPVTAKTAPSREWDSNPQHHALFEHCQYLFGLLGPAPTRTTVRGHKRIPRTCTHRLRECATRIAVNLLFR